MGTVHSIVMKECVLILGELGVPLLRACALVLASMQLALAYVAMHVHVSLITPFHEYSILL